MSVKWWKTFVFVINTAVIYVIFDKKDLTIRIGSSHWSMMPKYNLHTEMKPKGFHSKWTVKVAHLLLSSNFKLIPITTF